MNLAAAWSWIRTNAGVLAAIGAVIGGLVGGAWTAGQAMGKLTATKGLSEMQTQIDVLARDIERLDRTITEHLVTSDQPGELRQKLDSLRERFDLLVGRRWHDVTGLRRDDQCYVNNTDYPLEVAVSTESAQGANFCRVDIFVNDKLILQQLNNNGTRAKHCAATATVPPAARYRVNDDGYKNGRIIEWWELRTEGDAMDVQEPQCG